MSLLSASSWPSVNARSGSIIVQRFGLLADCVAVAAASRQSLPTRRFICENVIQADQIAFARKLAARQHNAVGIAADRVAPVRHRRMLQAQGVGAAVLWW